jgi:flagellar assembly factor FliW
MRIEKSKLGDIEIDDGKIITIDGGLPGFSDARRCVLVDTKPGSAFKWLLFVDRPDLAFVVADPFAFFPDYVAPLGEQELGSVGFEEGDELALLSVITVRGRRKDDTTFNLKAPIVVNMRTFSGIQLLQQGDRWEVRASLPAVDASAAPAGSGA